MAEKAKLVEKENRQDCKGKVQEEDGKRNE